MLQIPDDPVEVWITRAHKLGLMLMGEDEIISDRDMSIQTHPNRIVRSRLHFESLESEPDPNKLQGIARQLRLLKRSTHERYFPTVALQLLKRAR